MKPKILPVAAAAFALLASAHPVDAQSRFLVRPVGKFSTTKPVQPKAVLATRFSTPVAKPAISSRPQVRPQFSIPAITSKRPTVVPTKRPTAIPTQRPSVRPIEIPTKRPTVVPSKLPSVRPVVPVIPSARPVEIPAKRPTLRPVEIPSKRPTVRPEVAKRPTLPDARQMIEILKGKGAVRPSVTVPSGSRPSLPTRPELPKAAVLDRFVVPAPSALPKGMGAQTVMRKGRTPAEGTETGVLKMKDGRTQAEGENSRGVPISVRIKDGRPQAESGSEGRDEYDPPASVYQPEEAESSLSYRVDANSQLSTKSVKFQKASTRLDGSASYYYLQNLAVALRDPSLAGERFVIEGHASADGSDYTNLVLSQRRANAIFDYLVSAGVDSNRLLSVGHGEAHARFAAYEPEYLLADDRQVMVFRLAE